MKVNASLSALAILFVSSAACAPAASPRAAAAAPATGIWIDYQGMLYGHRVQPSGPGAAADRDHGYYPQFRIRLRDGAAAPEVQLLNAGAGDATRGASLLASIAKLDLPAGDRGEWFARYRDNERWEWRHRRIREGARHVAAEIDLRQAGSSAAADLCRSVEVEPVRSATAERCRIEAILDPADRWPIAAEITRSMSGEGGATATQTVTFERLSSQQAGAERASRSTASRP
jgi:hypothetical protein